MRNIKCSVIIIIIIVIVSVNGNQFAIFIRNNIIITNKSVYLKGFRYRFTLGGERQGLPH